MVLSARERRQASAAILLYRSSGYREIGPLARYGHDPLSLFFEKRLAG